MNNKLYIKAYILQYNQANIRHYCDIIPIKIQKSNGATNSKMNYIELEAVAS